MTPLRNFFIGTTINNRSTDFGLLLLRVAAGLAMALAHGRGKFPPGAQMVEGVAGLGFPMPEVFAWAAASAEFIGGFLLAIGLLTRPAALTMLATMATAFFLAHAKDPFGVKELAFLFGAIALLYVFSGAGRYSVDSLLNRKRR
jgi:putative oxidoreductase